jgi:hypothetical protein
MSKSKLSGKNPETQKRVDPTNPKSRGERVDPTNPKSRGERVDPTNPKSRGGSVTKKQR